MGVESKTLQSMVSEKAKLAADGIKPNDTKPLNPANVGFAISRRFRCRVGNCRFPMINKKSQKCWWHSHLSLTERVRWQKYEAYLKEKYGDYIKFKMDLSAISEQVGNIHHEKIRRIGRPPRMGLEEIDIGASLKKRAESLKAYFIKMGGA